jgi:hypothetical protein
VAGSLGRLPTRPKQPGASKGARQPASPRPRTGSSNPLPSRRESVSLRVSRRFEEKPGFSATMRTVPGGSGRQRLAKPSNVGPSSGGLSVGRYSSTAVLPDAVRDIGAGRVRSRLPRGSDLGGALSSDPLKQRRGGSVDLASRAAGASAPAASLRSDRAAGARRGWLQASRCPL